MNKPTNQIKENGGHKMNITRLIENVPTSKELMTAYENGILSYDECMNKMTECTNKEIEFVLNQFSHPYYFIAVSNKGDVVTAFDIDELFDGIVLKDLCYIALVDGYISIIRTDDNSIYRIFDGRTLSREIWA